MKINNYDDFVKFYERVKKIVKTGTFKIDDISDNKLFWNYDGNLNFEIIVKYNIEDGDCSIKTEYYYHDRKYSYTWFIDIESLYDVITSIDNNGLVLVFKKNLFSKIVFDEVLYTDEYEENKNYYKNTFFTKYFIKFVKNK